MLLSAFVIKVECALFRIRSIGDFKRFIDIGV